MTTLAYQKEQRVGKKMGSDSHQPDTRAGSGLRGADGGPYMVEWTAVEKRINLPHKTRGERKASKGRMGSPGRKKKKKTYQ